jgi:hypothetical protein
MCSTMPRAAFTLCSAPSTVIGSLPRPNTDPCAARLRRSTCGPAYSFQGALLLIRSQVLPQPPSSLSLEGPIWKHLHHRLPGAWDVDAEENCERILRDSLDGYLRDDDGELIVTGRDLPNGDLEQFLAKARVGRFVTHLINIRRGRRSASRQSERGRAFSRRQEFIERSQ